MKKDSNVIDAFKKRPNYKRTKSRKGRVYHPSMDPIGRYYLFANQRFGEMLCGYEPSNELERNFKHASRDRLFMMDKEHMPEFPVFFQQKAGYTWTPDIVYHRLHKGSFYTWTKSDGGLGHRSNEHYLHSKRLRPHVEAMSRLFDQGRPVTLDEMWIAGGGKGDRQKEVA